MPNEQNLIPGGYELTVEEQSKGGKKSAEVRRRKKTMKQVMDFLLEQPANTRADYEFLVEQGIDLNSLDPDFINNMLLVNAALMARAKQGDVAAVKELRDIIRDDDMLKHKIKYDNARLRLEKQKLEPVSMPDKVYSGIPASLVAPTFSPVLFDIAEQEHSEYVFPGGRGSTKSSFCGLNVIDLLMKNENMHACILRSVANTLKDSVYSQILWAISALGLDDEFACTKSPLEITRISTGQKIYFRGADDPHKIKSIKPPFVRVHYAPAQHTLFIWQEYTCNKTKNIDTAKHLLELGITANDLITCDSAENKSVEDYRAYGLLARGAEKGPNSREYSYKWLQSLRSIVIDNKRCPVACEEFINCEYDRDKEGNVISGYPDGNDHVIDAVRYAMERVWKRRGQ